jgi:hypothetical protein
MYRVYSHPAKVDRSTLIAGEPERSPAESEKTLRHPCIGLMVAALCIAAGAARGQSSIPLLSSIATVSFSVDQTNCSFNDPSQGVIWNGGTISITINNSETESALYQCETVGTAYDYIQNLANSINRNSPWVTATQVHDAAYGTNGGSLRLTSKGRGPSTLYPLSVSASYDTYDSYQDPNTGNLVPAFTGPAYVPSAPITMAAAGRNFVITTFADIGVGPADEDVAWMSGNGDPSFAANDVQPPGLSIMGVGPFAGQYSLPQKDFQGNSYDYNRVAAVYVDEPYAVAIGTSWSNPCHDSRYQSTILPFYQQLQSLANAIRQQAPKTRLWINYSEPEVQWMQDATCAANYSMAILNSAFIDVVSMDKYSVPFPGTTACLVPQQSAGCVQPYYDWLVAHRAYPGQQIALVPGIWAYPNGSNAESQALLLQGYFDYATNQNQTCNMPLGNTGATGHADGCLVWMTIGFAPHQNALGIGEDDPGAEPIQQAWRGEVGLPLTLALTRPSAMATVLSSNGTSFTYFLTADGQVYVIWCTASGCAWDGPGGDAHAAAAAAGSSLNVVAAANGLIAYYLTPSGHLISLNTSHGFSDTWQDITAAGGIIMPAPGSPLATVMSDQTPFAFFFSGGGQVVQNWCTTSGCTWDAPSGDAHAPAAAPDSPLNVVSTANGLVAYFLTANGHVISLNTSHGFSDTWQDVTAAGGTIAAGVGSPLVTVMSGQTPITYFLDGGGLVVDNWCTTSGCTWDGPSGDARAPAAAHGSPLTVVSTAHGLIACFLTPSGHVIALDTSHGFADTWQDITAAAGAPPAAIESSLTTVVAANGNVLTHFVVPGGHLVSISCTASGQCTSTDETAKANAAAVAFF